MASETDKNLERISAYLDYWLIRRHMWSEAEHRIKPVQQITDDEVLIRDLRKSSALHIAAKEGHAKLLPVAAAAEEGHANMQPNYLWQDCDDMNPVHIASMKGHVEHLLQQSHLLAIENVYGRETFIAMKKRLYCRETLLAMEKTSLYCRETLFAMTNSLYFLDLHLGANDENGVTTKFLPYWPKLAETIQALVENIKLDSQTRCLMVKKKLESLDPQGRTITFCEITTNNNNIMVKLLLQKSKGLDTSDENGYQQYQYLDEYSSKHRSETIPALVENIKLGWLTKLESLDHQSPLKKIIIKADMNFRKSVVQSLIQEWQGSGLLSDASDEKVYEEDPNLVEHSRFDLVDSISYKSSKHRSNLAEIIQPSLESIELKRQTPDCIELKRPDHVELKRQTPDLVGKTKLKSLDQGPQDTTTWYLEIIMKNIPAVATAMAALQSAINPPGGRWPEDTQLHKAGDAVIAYAHPNIYKYLMLTNSIALSSSLLTIFLFITGWPSRSNFIRWTAKFAMWVSLLAIAMSYIGSTMAIAPHEKTKSVDPIVMILVMLVSIIITIVISTSHHLIVFYLDWKRKIQCEEDLTTDHLHKRILYRIFQLWTS